MRSLLIRSTCVSTIRRQQYRFKPTLSSATLCVFLEEGGKIKGGRRKSEIRTAVRREGSVRLEVHDKKWTGGEERRARKGRRHRVHFTKKDFPPDKDK